MQVHSIVAREYTKQYNEQKQEESCIYFIKLSNKYFRKYLYHTKGKRDNSFAELYLFDETTECKIVNCTQDRQVQRRLRTSAALQAFWAMGHHSRYKHLHAINNDIIQMHYGMAHAKLSAPLDTLATTDSDAVTGAVMPHP